MKQPIQLPNHISLRYEDAIALIEKIYGPETYELNEACLSGFEYSVENESVTGCWHTYDRVYLKDHKVFWPIQPYKVKVPNGENFDYFEKITKKQR